MTPKSPFVFIAVINGFFLPSFGQNLVPNAGFEEYKYLPCELNDRPIDSLLRHWFRPMPASPDYWNTSADENCLMNPTFLNIESFEGHGMVGLIGVLIYEGRKDEYKEHVEIELIENLKPGRIYCGSFHTLNINDGIAPLHENGFDILEMNNWSMGFSDKLIRYAVGDESHQYLANPDLKKITTEDIIPADNNWHEIAGCFIPEREYKYLLLGNFDSVGATQINRIGNIHKYAYAYYFIDKVSVIELPFTAPAPEKQSILCQGENQVTLNATSEGAIGYLWEDGSTTPEYKVTSQQSRAYSVNIIYEEGILKHTFSVRYVPNVSLGPDTLLCEGESITIVPENISSDFLWSDGSTEAEKVVSATGTYWIENLSECYSKDSINVLFAPCPGFIPNVITPNGDQWNQVFKVENIDNRTWSLVIFNRWGKKIYEIKDYNNAWDGRGVPDGIYYYLLKSEQLEIEKKGWVQIITN